MNIIPKDIPSFRLDLRQAMDVKKSTQKDVERLTGVSQTTICNFLQGKRGISGNVLLKLCHFVYEHTPPPTTPASPPAPGSPEEAADAAARAKRRRGRPRRHPDDTPATGAGAEQGTSGAPGCDAGAA